MSAIRLISAAGAAMMLTLSLFAGATAPPELDFDGSIDTGHLRRSHFLSRPLSEGWPDIDTAFSDFFDLIEWGDFKFHAMTIMNGRRSTIEIGFTLEPPRYVDPTTGRAVPRISYIIVDGEGFYAEFAQDGNRLLPEELISDIYDSWLEDERKRERYEGR